MDNKKLYIELQILLNEHTFRYAEKLAREIAKIQSENLDQVLNSIARVLLKYTVVGEKMNIPISEQKKLYSEISRIISENCGKEKEFEKERLDSWLNEVALNKYNYSSYLMMFDIDWKVTKISNKDLVKIINAKIDNLIYSDRLYKNKAEIEASIKKEVYDLLKGDGSINEIERNIRRAYDLNKYNSKRLVVTETARVQEAINDVWCAYNGVEYVMRSETLDSKTCARCSEWDNVEVKVAEKPFDILHPLCRGTWIALPLDGWRPSERMNNETKEVEDYKSYKEWLKENNL